MHTETIPYFHGQTKCLGFLAYDDQVESPRPGVLVAHAWRGQDDFARQKAIELAQLGYAGFAVDLYGDGLSVDDSEAPKLMAPLFLNRALLQERIGAAYDCTRSLSAVDPSKIGAIGFCFGGLTVLELLRSGVNLKGVVGFHGVYADEWEGSSAKTVPISPGAAGSLLILQGDQDPFIAPNDLLKVEREMTEAGIDWQVHLYGGIMHAFTNPSANNRENGTMYNQRAEIRSWHAMQNFFAEVFS